MRIITATPYLSKNTPFPVVCNECKSSLEMAPVDVFVDTEYGDNGLEELHPKYTCPVCASMVEITNPVIPRRILEIWRAQQPV